MRASRRVVWTVATSVASASWVLAGIGQAPAPPQGVLMEPIGQAGEAVYPAFEGWGPAKDGSTVFLLGYFNRNKEQSVDVPIGPNNRIEPGGPDMGQPTHFHPGRQYGVFAIKVPKDFGTQKLTWTLVANGHPVTVSFWQNPPYWIGFYKHQANGNEPPVVRILPDGPEFTGPPIERYVQTLNGAVGQPVELKLWARDQPPTYATAEAGATPGGDAAAGRGGRRPARDPASEPPPAIIGGRVFSGGLTPLGGGAAAAARNARGDIRVIWKKYRGPGDVKVADEAIALMNEGDAKRVLEARTTATFSAPGEYWLRAQVNDSSGDGGGGDQCCWTTVHVRVVVK